MSLIPLYSKIRTLPRDNTFQDNLDQAMADQAIDDLAIISPISNKLANELRPICVGVPHDVAFSWMVRCSGVACYSYVSFLVTFVLQNYDFGKEYKQVKVYGNIYLSSLCGILLRMLESGGKKNLVAKPNELFPISQECQEVCDCRKLSALNPLSLDHAIRYVFDSRVDQYTRDWVDSYNSCLKSRLASYVSQRFVSHITGSWLPDSLVNYMSGLEHFSSFAEPVIMSLARLFNERDRIAM